MYIKEVMEEMEKNHALSLEANILSIKLLDKYLLGGEVPDNLIAHLSLYFLTKFHKTLLAFRLLVVSGFDEDASILLRTLVEAAITLGYISKEPNQRVDRFIEFEFIAQYKLLNNMDKHYPLTGIEDERRNTINEEFLNHQNKFPRKDQWSDKPLSQMGEEVGMSFWYDMVYKPDSSYVQ